MRASKPSRSIHFRALLIAALAVTACGDDGPTGPSDDFDIVGAWDWSVNNAAATNAACSVTNVRITFAREAGTLTGHRMSTAGNNFSCTVHGSSSTFNYTTNDDLDDLSLTGTSISFVFMTTTGNWEMDGQILTDDSMGGTATIRIDTSVGPFVLTGPWTATRN